MDVPQICGKGIAGGTCYRIPGHAGECIPGSAYKMAINSQYGKAYQRSLLNLVPNRVKYLIIVATAIIWAQVIFDIIVAIRLTLCHHSKSPPDVAIATGNEQAGTCQRARSQTCTTKSAVMR